MDIFYPEDYTRVKKMIVILDEKEGKKLYRAMGEFVRENKGQKNAKKIFKQMEKEWTFFEEIPEKKKIKKSR